MEQGPRRRARAVSTDKEESGLSSFHTVRLRADSAGSVVYAVDARSAACNLPE